MLDRLPNLNELHTVIAKVPGYPVTAGQLVELAAAEHAPQPVIDFYRSFSPDEIFSNEEDLVARSEHIEIMHREDQPVEVLSDEP
jgi:hypothetical protein